MILTKLDRKCYFSLTFQGSMFFRDCWPQPHGLKLINVDAFIQPFMLTSMRTYNYFFYISLTLLIHPLVPRIRLAFMVIMLLLLHFQRQIGVNHMKLHFLSLLARRNECNKVMNMLISKFDQQQPSQKSTVINIIGNKDYYTNSCR